MKKNNNKKIIELEFTDKLFNYIDDARYLVNIGNKARFFKESLHHFIWCIHRRSEGYRFAIFNDDEAFEYDIINE